MSFDDDARRGLEKLRALGYTEAAARGVALELLALLESLPPGLCLMLGKVDDGSALALLTRPPPELFRAASLGAVGILADDFATAAGAELGKHSPHLEIDAAGLFFNPGKKVLDGCSLQNPRAHVRFWLASLGLDRRRAFYPSRPHHRMEPH